MRAIIQKKLDYSARFKFFSITTSIMLVLLLMQGCDKLRGEKGDTVELTSVTYTGTPTSNPFEVTCPAITDLTKQIITISMESPSHEITALPITYGDNIYEPISNSTGPSTVSHYYVINNQKVTFTSQYSTIFPAMNALIDIVSFITHQPATTVSTTQNNYRIDVKTFSSSSAVIAYKKANRLDTSTYDSLIFGRESNPQDK